MDELITCPFCGNHPDPPERIEYRWAVYCPTCEYWGPRGDTPGGAALAWATREEVKHVLGSIN